MDGYFFIVKKTDVPKRHRGAAARTANGKGLHHYELHLVDEDWNPLPSPISMDPNHMPAINEALGPGNALSEDNFVICRLKPNGKYAVSIDEVVTDSQEIVHVREKAIKRRKRVKPPQRPANAIKSKYGGSCGKCGLPYEPGELIVKDGKKYNWVDCPLCREMNDPVSSYHSDQITKQGRKAVIESAARTA